MTELAEIFDDFNLTQYLHSFLEQGFDTWDTILDITEQDLFVFCLRLRWMLTRRSDALGVKLGHRRVR